VQTVSTAPTVQTAQTVSKAEPAQTTWSCVISGLQPIITSTLACFRAGRVIMAKMKRWTHDVQISCPFLQENELLNQAGIYNNVLVTLAVQVTESDPKQKDLLV
jgi:hypothetical protein